MIYNVINLKYALKIVKFKSVQKVYTSCSKNCSTVSYSRRYESIFC